MASIKHINPQNDEEENVIRSIQEFDGTLQEWIDNELQEIHEEQDEDRRDEMGEFIKMAKREGLKVNVPTREELINL
jgi:hypothetical protein